MRITLSRQGNSLGLRIPREIATECGLVEGARVAIQAHGDHIVIAIPRLRYRLEDLLGGMRPEAMHEAFDWARMPGARSSTANDGGDDGAPEADELIGLA